MANDNGFAVLPSFIARDPSIEPILKTLLLALSSFAGAEQTCYPSNKTLCDCTGLSERAVREWLSTGAERGLLTVHRRVTETGAPASNLYSLNFAKWGSPDEGVSANPAGGVGRHGAPGGAPPCPRWGATVPPNNTIEQDQENKTKDQSTPLPSVATPDLFGQEERSKRSKKTIAELRADLLMEDFAVLCPSLPKPPASARAAILAAYKREPDLELWRTRMRRAEASDFLAGRKTEWRASAVWIFGPKNVVKLDSGQYDNHKPKPGATMRVGNQMVSAPQYRNDEDDELF